MKKGPIRLPKAYLAGPMTGYPEHNFPAFREYTKWLRNHGYEVVSPEELETAEGPGPRKEWAYYLVRDLRELLGCDCIAVLPGWQKSRGATLEVYVGWRLGFSIFDARDFTVLDVSSFNFAKAGRIPETNADSFIKAFCPPVMKRSISDVARGEVSARDRYEQIMAPPVAEAEKPKPENILKEADRIVGGDRNAAYGHPKTDFERTAMIWSAILGIKVSAEQIPLCMIGVKMSRQCNAAKRDNWVDMAGYAQTGYMVDQKDGRME
jgi:hypothetical protein